VSQVKRMQFMKGVSAGRERKAVPYLGSLFVTEIIQGKFCFTYCWTVFRFVSWLQRYKLLILHV